jgi:hypothetical protein
MIGVASITLVAVHVSCGDSSKYGEELIPLPTRDGSTTDIPDGGGAPCACPNAPHATGACVDGGCSITCDPGWGNCNNDLADGCEKELSNDVANCGACGRDCRTCKGTACTNALCDAPLLGSPAVDILLLANDPSRVTYADKNGIGQFDKADGGAYGVFGVTNSPGIAVAGLTVFFISPGKTAGNGIYRTTAGFIGPQAPYIAAGQNAEALAVDDTGLYYAVEVSNAASRLLRCFNCNGNPTELSANENRFGANGIALDATTVFFGAGDMIRRVEKVGGEVKTLAVGQRPISIAVDATHVYWINTASISLGDAGPADGAVLRIAKTGGGTPETLASQLPRPLSLSVQGNWVYVSDRSARRVWRMEKDGQRPLDLAKGSADFGGLTVDEKCAWFGTSNQVRGVTR